MCCVYFLLSRFLARRDLRTRSLARGRSMNFADVNAQNLVIVLDREQNLARPHGDCNARRCKMRFKTQLPRGAGSCRQSIFSHRPSKAHARISDRMQRSLKPRQRRDFASKEINRERERGRRGKEKRDQSVFSLDFFRNASTILHQAPSTCPPFARRRETKVTISENVYDLRLSRVNFCRCVRMKFFL